MQTGCVDKRKMTSVQHNTRACRQESQYPKSQSTSQWLPVYELSSLVYFRKHKDLREDEQRNHPFSQLLHSTLINSMLWFLTHQISNPKQAKNPRILTRDPRKECSSTNPKVKIQTTQVLFVVEGINYSPFHLLLDGHGKPTTPDHLTKQDPNKHPQASSRRVRTLLTLPSIKTLKLEVKLNLNNYKTFPSLSTQDSKSSLSLSVVILLSP